MLDSLPTELYNDTTVDHPSSIIAKYLQENSTDFQRLSEIRRKGWQSKAGDEYFRRQRHQADKANKKTRQFFYEMMQRIGLDLDRSTGCFTIQGSEGNQPRLLDMCAAPGGFIKVALDLNPGVIARGFTLPDADGGHQLLVPESPSIRITPADITMFAEDMDVFNVPEDHPQCDRFLPRQLAADDLFDLVVCDGQVLRTHKCGEHRESREARRLSTTQLSLGLQHVRSGGSMLILMHKVEAWPTVYLLYKFDRFSTIRLFKPTGEHAKRSSFYLIASNIRTENPDVSLMVDNLKTMWRVSTFGTNDEYEVLLHKSETMVDEVLQKFGPALLKLGGKVWKIQEMALSQASFNQADQKRSLRSRRSKRSER